MSHKKLFLLFFLTLSINFFMITPVSAEITSHAYSEYTFTSKDEIQRFESLLKETRCVVCQNQNLADSNAPLAKDLRQKIYRMIKDKKSDVEIKNYLVTRYGEFILLRPRFEKLTFLLWAFPFIGLILVFLFIRRLK